MRRQRTHPRRDRHAGSTSVEAIIHADKRANLPVSGEDAREFVTEEIERPVALRYPRDTTLDPQLVWKGKDEQDADALIVDAPPVYIQEKIDPRAIVANLRRTTEGETDEPELRLFDSFDGLPPLDLVDFYRHEANWSNRMILGDSLNVMASLTERESMRGKVQMIYMDPPYGVRFNSNWQVSVNSTRVRDGRFEDATREVEQIRAFRDTWDLGINSYLGYLRDRLAAARELLTDSGSFFMQIGDENVHLVRALLDEIFGSGNFCALIAFRKTTGANSPVARVNVVASIADFLVWYAKDIDRLKYRQLYQEKDLRDLRNYSQVEDPLSGSSRQLTEEERLPGNAPNGVYQLENATSAGWSDSLSRPFVLSGREYRPGANAHWKTTPPGMAKLAVAGRLVARGNTINYKRYLSDFATFPLTNVWNDIRVGYASDPRFYVVQTSSQVIERCLLMSTDPGDLVLDPTCGSGTTAYVAELWGRRWITIDTSRVALALSRQRIMGTRYPYNVLADSPAGRRKEAELTGASLPDAPTTNDIRQGFVYERVRHITLKSIANNPDIHEGMSREQIDDAIKRHAEYELLFDKPYNDPRTVRVSGPFTVESLSPHRSWTPPVQATSDGSDNAGSDAVFEDTVRENLATSGIQNGRRQERLTFDTVERYAASYIQFIGERGAPSDGTPRRVGISVGPQYGTVGPPFIKHAAREAIRAGDIDLLCILAFAFDPTVLGGGDGYVTSDESFAEVAAERRMGRVPVLLVRMNADLVMGRDLKNMPNANLFTVFGEPDIELRTEGDKLRVVINGVDVYDPNTGELRSRSTERIALWMIDTDYDGESFFVRHCYFTGGHDPYERLKRALRADIDESAWEALYRTESLPFARPERGRIAVKVINDYGDEVVKVLNV